MADYVMAPPGLAIEGTSLYRADKRGDDWLVRSLLDGWWGFLPSRPKYKLEMDDGSIFEGSMAQVLRRTELAIPVGREIPGFSSYRLDDSQDRSNPIIRTYASGSGSMTEPGAPLLNNARGQTIDNPRVGCTLKSDEGEFVSQQLAYWVLLAHGHPKPGPEYFACHVNDVAMDCRIENLYWGLPADNRIDAKNNGRLRRGDNHPAAVFTSETALEAFLGMRRDGWTMKYTRERYGVTHFAAQQLRDRLTWRHVTDAIPDSELHFHDGQHGRHSIHSVEVTREAFIRWNDGESPKSVGDDLGMSEAMVILIGKGKRRRKDTKDLPIRRKVATRTRITEDEKLRFKELYASGKTVDEIAIITERSTAAVGRYLGLYR